MDFTTLKSAISQLSSTEEIRKANNLLKAQHRKLMSEQTRQFAEGDVVMWTHKGMEYTGSIKRVNTKTCTVIDSGGFQWRISPNHLTKQQAA